MPATTTNRGIQRTKDYDTFTMLHANRELNRAHIEKIKESFAKNGNFTRVQPILVNEKMEIIDGQHRFVAAKETDQTVYFTVAPGVGVKEARQMNALQKGWTPEDFAKSYADSGQLSYRNYLLLKEEYNFNHSILLAYTSGVWDKKGQYRDFINGEYLFNDMNGARERLDNLQAMAEINPVFKVKNLGVALLVAMSIEGYNQDRMEKQVKNASTLVPYQGITENLRQLENLYNKGYTSNRLRFF